MPRSCVSRSCVASKRLTTTNDALVRRNLLSFVVVGAGATGVELAGQIKELARRYFAKSINNISADEVTVTMVRGRGRCASGLRRQAQ